MLSLPVSPPYNVPRVTTSKIKDQRIAIIIKTLAMKTLNSPCTTQNESPIEMDKPIV